MRQIATIECCPPVLVDRLSEADAEAAARVFRALGDPARVRILSFLASQPGAECCACDVIPVTGLSQPTVSHHLKILVDAGLLQREKRGTWAYYRLDKRALAAVRAALR